MTQKKIHRKERCVDRGEEAESFLLGRKDLSLYPGGCLHVQEDGKVAPLNALGNVLLSTLSDEGLQTFVEWLQFRNTGDTLNFMLGDFTRSQMVIVLPVEQGGWLVFCTDFSMERNLRTVLVESRQRYKDFIELSTDFVWEIDANGRFSFVSSHGFLGYPVSHVIGMTPEDFVIGWDSKDRPSSPFLTHTLIEHTLLTASSRDGKLLHLIISAKPLFDSQGSWCGARGVCRDITEEKQSEKSLRIKNQLMLTIRDVTDPGIMLQTAAENISRVMGARGSQIFFRTEKASSSFFLKEKHGKCGPVQSLLEALQQKDVVSEVIDGWRVMAIVCFYHQRVNGALSVWRREIDPDWTEMDAQLLADIASQIGIVNEQVATHEHILHLSRTDGLTGLFNRRAFFEELERYLQRLQRTGKQGALIYIDLDNFKLVNDTHGHMTGDQILQNVRDLLIKHSRPEDLVGCLGGDEFALWLYGAGKHTAINRCKSLLQEAEKMAYLSGKEDAPFGFSMGIAIYDPKSGETLEELVARADTAMYTIKRDGKGGLSIAPPVVDSSYNH